VRTELVNGIEIAYEITGPSGGDAVLLIHGSNLATGLRPLAAALADARPSLRLIRYHRRGMGGSGGRGWPSSLAEQARDAVGLLDALDIPSAHLLGYSSGAVVALEGALQAPGRVQSLVLLEPILTEVPSGEKFLSGMTPIMQLYADGDLSGAVTATFESLGGAFWRDLVATAGHDAYEQAVQDTEIFYRAEFPALRSYRLDPVRAAATQIRVLSVAGTRSGSFFTEGRPRLHRVFDHCVDVDIPDVNHFLYLQAPQQIATIVARFIPNDG
jgi:pimeloyl-ACP methyl ester carboxylesterase